MMKWLLALICSLACLACSPAKAEQYPFKIYALGIPIGKASIGLTREASTYHLTFNGKFGGLIAIFTGAKGAMDITGQFDDKTGAKPENILTDIQWSERLRHTVAQFKDNRVVHFEVTPPYTYEPEKRIPLDHDDLHDVQDPLSSMLRPLDNGKLSCDARRRIFDGRERYDLVFSPTKDPWTCHVQPIPVSGYDYRKKSPTNPPESLEITFAPVQDESMALPTRFVRKMLLGTVEVTRILQNERADEDTFKPATNN